MNRIPLVIVVVALVTSHGQAADVSLYLAELTSESVVSTGIRGTSSTLTGRATFVLTEPEVGPPTLSYSISMPDADLSRSSTPDLSDNITAIHLHDTNTCVSPLCIPGDTAGTLHTLNIFGVPRSDDADLVLDEANGIVTGLWDASDANALAPAPSAAPVDFLSELRAGELFLMVHTQTEPGGAFGGFLVAVPEPGSLWLAVGVVSFGSERRRRDSQSRASSR